MKKSYENIFEILHEFSTEEIVRKAWEGLIPNSYDGWCLFDPETGELISASLKENEIILSSDRIYLYKIDANVFNTAVYNINGDILSPEEYKKFKKLGYDDVEKFLAEHSEDTFNDRFFDFLVFYAEEKDIINDNVKEQVKIYCENIIKNILDIIEEYEMKVK